MVHVTASSTLLWLSFADELAQRGVTGVARQFGMFVGFQILSFSLQKKLVGNGKA